MEEALTLCCLQALAVTRSMPAILKEASLDMRCLRGAFAGDDQPSFPVCGACGKRRYCGEACQIADWEAGHARKCG